MDLNLIFASFTESDTSSEIETLFVGTGYRVVLSDLEHHLKVNSQNDKILVVSLQTSNSDIAMLKKLLTLKSDNIPCFCIFHCCGDQLNSNLLKYCSDFVIWPCSSNELFFRLHRLVNKANRTGSSRLQNKIHHTMIGESVAFQKVLKSVQIFSSCDAPVLIEGATGTGKEMVARAIHYQSNRKDFPFIPVNCGALPDSLIENELFGHERGAYTDAKANSKGVVGQAEGGTLFLDELESLSSKGQVALLRLLQEHEFKPLGANVSIKCNLRFVSATNISLKKLAEEGTFRDDLYYRLNILSVVLPLLRDREQDILLLANFFLNKFRKKYHSSGKQFVQSALLWINQHSWAGNIRELETYIHRAFLLSGAENISAQHFNESQTDFVDQLVSTAPVQSVSTNVSFKDAKSKAIDVFEKFYLKELMERTEGNVTKAAKKACKERRALGKLLKKHGIDRAAFML